MHIKNSHLNTARSISTEDMDRYVRAGRSLHGQAIRDALGGVMRFLFGPGSDALPHKTERHSV